MSEMNQKKINEPENNLNKIIPKVPLVRQTNDPMYLLDVKNEYRDDYTQSLYYALVANNIIQDENYTNTFINETKEPITETKQENKKEKTD
jgi:hypothetical protein